MQPGSLLAGGASPEGNGLAEVVVAPAFALTLEDDGAILQVHLVVVVVQQVVLPSGRRPYRGKGGTEATVQLHQSATNGNKPEGRRAPKATP